MANRCHDRRTGRFISAARSRVQAVLRLTDRTDEDWTADEDAMAILEAGMALAVKDGWIPPDQPARAGRWEALRNLTRQNEELGLYDPDDGLRSDAESSSRVDELADAWPHALTQDGVM